MLLPESPARETIRARIRALNAAGELAKQLDGANAAEALHDEALRLGHAIGDEQGIAGSLLGLFGAAQLWRDRATRIRRRDDALAYSRRTGDRLGVAQLLGSQELGESAIREALAVQREMGDRSSMGWSLLVLGNLARERGDHSAARDYYKQALLHWREIIDRRNIAFALNNLGIVAYAQEDLDTARTLWQESLAIRREIGARRGISESLEFLGQAAHATGEVAVAHRFHEESLALAQELGDAGYIADSHYNLGLVAIDEQRFGDARAHLEQCLAFYAPRKNPWRIALLLEGYAWLAAAAQQFERALCLAGAAAALRRANNRPRYPIEEKLLARRLAPAKHAPDGQTASAAWSSGEALSLEEAVSYAVDAGDVAAHRSPLVKAEASAR